MSSRPNDTCCSRARSRGRLAAVALFSSVVGGGLASRAGYTTIEESAKILAKIFSEYCCVTRAFNWMMVISQLSPSGVCQTFHTSPSVCTSIARIATAVVMGLFLASEEIALLAERGALRRSLHPYASQLVPIFFFYYNLLKMVTSAALLQAAQRISFEATDSQSIIRKRQYKELFLNFLESIAFMVHAMTLLPVDAPRLVQAVRERYWDDRSCAVLSSLCPHVLRVSSLTQGIIGLIATFPSFFLNS